MHFWLCAGSFPALCAAVTEEVNELSNANTRRRHAPLMMPTSDETTSLPPEAVWIPAFVEQGVRLGTSSQIAQHWQPFIRPRPPSEPGALLCCECFGRLECCDESGRQMPREGGEAALSSPDLAHEELPRNAECGWSVRHTERVMLFCGGRCMREWRVRREPAAVRRELRKQHVLAHVTKLFSNFLV